MKKLIKIFAFIVAFVCLTGLAACGEKDSRQVTVAHTVGTFSGYRVDLAKITTPDTDVAEVVVDYEVDGVFIASLPNPSWKYIVWTDEDNYIYLNKAYEQGIISRDDLVAISAAEGGYDEKGNVFIIPQRTVGTFSGCRVDVAQVIEPNMGYPCVEVDYTVDGIFIGYLPDPSFKYLVYEADGDFHYLDVAYEQGIITRDDLVAIAKTEAEYSSVNT